jgi:hypothetical protein
MELAVRSGKFRRDLFYRLNQFQILVPPLRERPEDIVAIADHFLHQYHPNSRFSEDALKALQEYSWPGNVRELKNLVFKAVMQAENPAEQIQAADLAFETATTAAKSNTTTPGGGPALSGIEKRAILEALTRAGGRRGRAAELLGISRRTLSRKLKEYKDEAQRERAGVLSYQQQRYFRVVSEFSVQLSSADKQFEAVCANVSSTGLGLRLPQSGDFPSTVTLKFTLPDTSHVIETPAQLAWVDADAHAGFRFLDMSSENRQVLETWLEGHMVAEGWLPELSLTQRL